MGSLFRRREQAPVALITITVMLGMIMAIIDTTIVNVAFETIGSTYRDFTIPLSTLLVNQNVASTGATNPFQTYLYQRLGGKPVAEASIRIGGEKVSQTAFVWDPIEQLLAASPQAS